MREVTCCAARAVATVDSAFGVYDCTSAPCESWMEDIRCGVISTPLLAMPAATMAFWSAVVCTLYWPMELCPKKACEFEGRLGNTDLDTPGRSMAGTELYPNNSDCLVMT